MSQQVAPKRRLDRGHVVFKACDNSASAKLERAVFRNRKPKVDSRHIDRVRVMIDGRRRGWLSIVWPVGVPLAAVMVTTVSAM